MPTNHSPSSNCAEPIGASHSGHFHSHKLDLKHAGWILCPQDNRTSEILHEFKQSGHIIQTKKHAFLYKCVENMWEKYLNPKI